ncbi:uncharacterized protein DSM5745_06187 [Aspergillus mulundensis]|uniref:Protein kinase domain-containing protein n=1 Tax=Aspergillus mulundensis TaxID=1810919 RepID=A0A3D8RZ74_9EURO|nr:Uncharacterized protein DSM5745_06187 [Aspergillus mulundensis]RDW79335.1 Uncharacterized protein DSM5745_06187 [Aspergillus mulundensis]
MPSISHLSQWQVWPAIWLLVSSFSSRVSSLLRLSIQPVATAPNDEVLSLDLEENDFLYRIRKNSRIVYVSILDGGLLPPDSRTDSGRVLSKLRHLPRWEEEWRTLTVRRGAHGVQSTLDEFSPHGLDAGQLHIPGAIFLNLLDLKTVSRISDRISRVKYNGDTWILKIAQFRHEISALRREVSVYSTLTSNAFPLAPKFIGFAYEETKDRVVGFLMEDISGHHPDIHDLKDCMETVHRLHTFGIVHGDLNRHNFLITEHGAKIFDFEVSVVEGNVDPAAAEEELNSLAIGLEDESGIGKR